LLFKDKLEKCVKLSYEELIADGGSFEGTFQFAVDDFKVNVKSYKADFLPVETGLYLQLAMEFEFSAPCDKCLEKTTGFGREKAGLQLTKQHEGRFNEEIELGDDDMGVCYIEEDEVDLNEIIRQEVEFFIPVKMVCGDDCRGLCQTCGENLNLSSCSCVQEGDHRWSALKNIKKN